MTRFTIHGSIFGIWALETGLRIIRVAPHGHAGEQ